jgi:4-azaleucine resistance transporter AzlC
MIGDNPPTPSRWRRIAAGARDSLPAALGVVTYGLVFGVLARQKNLSPLDILAMSGTVFSGSAQFVALDLWAPPLPIVPILLSTLVISLRYLLICASCRPLFAHVPHGRALVAMFFVSDENWAVTMARAGRDDGAGAAHLIGGGCVMYLAWSLSTALGGAAGTLVADPVAWGLDFAFPATFLALLIGMWRGKQDLIPWAIAAAVATATSLVLPGKWYILIGGLAGSLCGALRRDP